MGVKDLWSVLEPVKQQLDIKELKGQTVAVDLSIWIVEAQSLSQMKHMAKPHLRHIFFRITHLLELDILPVIVVEGTPPEIKQGKMLERQKEHGWRGKKGPSAGWQCKKQAGRSRFDAIHRECCEMLDCIGVPWVQASGEAEACCAFLNKEQLVDGCITNDGDVFLYGARTVYKNFSIAAKESNVECYYMKDIEVDLGLQRDDLIGLAVLMGCDYLPGGVAKVGKETALKLVAALHAQSTLLERFRRWKTLDDLNGLSGIEKAVASKALSVPQFPFIQVINEFLIQRDVRPAVKLNWRRPRISPFVSYATAKMEWEIDYSFTKILPLASQFDMKQLIKGVNGSECLQPDAILKQRVKNGVPCYEVQWCKDETWPAVSMECLVTIETRHMVDAAFPLLIQRFVKDLTEKISLKNKKKGKMKDGVKGNKVKSIASTQKSQLYVEKDDASFGILSQDGSGFGARDQDDTHCATVEPEEVTTSKLSVRLLQSLRSTEEVSRMEQLLAHLNINGTATGKPEVQKHEVQGSEVHKRDVQNCKVRESELYNSEMCNRNEVHKSDQFQSEVHTIDAYRSDIHTIENCRSEVHKSEALKSEMYITEKCHQSEVKNSVPYRSSNEERETEINLSSSSLCENETSADLFNCESTENSMVSEKDKATDINMAAGNSMVTENSMAAENSMVAENSMAEAMVVFDTPRYFANSNNCRDLRALTPWSTRQVGQFALCTSLLETSPISYTSANEHGDDYCDNEDNKIKSGGEFWTRDDELTSDSSDQKDIETKTEGEPWISFDMASKEVKTASNLFSEKRQRYVEYNESSGTKRVSILSAQSNEQINKGSNMLQDKPIRNTATDNVVSQDFSKSRNIAIEAHVLQQSNKSNTKYRTTVHCDITRGTDSQYSKDCHNVRTAVDNCIISRVNVAIKAPVIQEVSSPPILTLAERLRLKLGATKPSGSTMSDLSKLLLEKL